MGEVKYLKDVLDKLKAEKPIERSVLARAIIYLALTNTKDNKKINEYKELKDLAKRYEDL